MRTCTNSEALRGAARSGSTALGTRARLSPCMATGTGRASCSEAIGTSARHWQDECWQQAAEVVVDDFGKEGGSKYSWKTFPRSSWPSYHRLDASFAQIKLFVYPLPAAYHRGVLRALVALMNVNWAEHNASYCLLRRCACGAGTTRLQLRQITSEVPVLLRLLQTATLVDDARHADGFIVPFPVASWQRHAAIRKRPYALRALMANLSSHLVHLNRETAAQHIFFASQDSCFNPLGLHVPHAERAIVLNLGPGHWNTTRLRTSRFKRRARFDRTITIPHRSELPDVESRAFGSWDGARPILLFGAMSGQRNPARLELMRAIRRHAALAPGRIVVGELTELSPNGSFGSLAELTRSSVFCLAIAGDAPSFTSRFYFSVIRGCIPVYLGPMGGYLLTSPKAWGGEPEEPEFPFAHLIDWKRIVLVLNKTTAVLSSSEPSYDALVERLIELEPRAASVRRYMRRVAHWLLFDAHAADGTLHRQDAASAAIYSIGAKLGLKPLEREAERLKQRALDGIPPSASMAAAQPHKKL
jgi:hypothetical protein